MRKSLCVCVLCVNRNLSAKNTHRVPGSHRAKAIEQPGQDPNRFTPHVHRVKKTLHQKKSESVSPENEFASLNIFYPTSGGYFRQKKMARLLVWPFCIVVIHSFLIMDTLTSYFIVVVKYDCF